eukprot:206821-Rhodomonas_salina.2
MSPTQILFASCAPLLSVFSSADPTTLIGAGGFAGQTGEALARATAGAAGASPHPAQQEGHAGEAAARKRPPQCGCALAKRHRNHGCDATSLQCPAQCGFELASRRRCWCGLALAF